MIVALTLNPALDVTVDVEDLRLGESHRTPPAHRQAGGKGVNVARVLAGQAIPVRVLASIGGPAGEEFSRELLAAGLESRLVTTATPTRTSLTLRETLAGRATVLNENGGHPGAEALIALAEHVETESDVDGLVISGSLPTGMAPSVLADLVEAAGRRDVPTVVDAAGAALVAAADAGATLLKPNASELRAACRAAPGPVSAARELLARGARGVVVTNGERGMIAVDDRGARTARSRRILHGNPTGAGDAATASLAASVLAGDEIDAKALARAVAWSASAVLMPFAGFLHASWPELLADVEVTDLADTPEEDRWHW